MVIFQRLHQKRDHGSVVQDAKMTGRHSANPVLLVAHRKLQCRREEISQRGCDGFQPFGPVSIHINQRKGNLQLFLLYRSLFERDY